jgi:hypothetical protein
MHLSFILYLFLRCLIENSMSTALGLFVIMYCIGFIQSYTGQSSARELEMRLTSWANPRQENIFVARRNTDERD